MTTQNTLELAKQGATQAISTLMNKALETKGITTKVNISGESITVIGESQEIIEQSFFVDYVRKVIEKLELPVKRLYIRGQITDNKNPIWRQTINLEAEIPKPVINTENSGISKAKFDIFKILIQFSEIINTALLAGILGILLFNLWWQPQPKTVEWEYKIESFEDVIFDSSMNRMGNEGWELVFARRALTGGEYSSRGIYECIFRRPKQKSNDKSEN
ncbi:hypothetical protein H6F32_09290 [Anabaena sp. FACHB-1237]|uniref:hypothetical protein n=1 Tax=Anabaena sp. FACHB-1237 TaxID=2692769 RepID=UPI001681B754|nr:hypothetical protein [Anabaena sp. FACHB-1237]MBD2137779.1 hypothetical protein [Anabaena sp. FACHB-1237]